jgi:hypothetical protein
MSPKLKTLGIIAEFFEEYINYVKYATGKNNKTKLLSHCLNN